MPTMFKALSRRELLLGNSWSWDWGCVGVEVRIVSSVDVGRGEVFGMLSVSLKSQSRVRCQATGLR
jgi:hypothetical protein